MIPLVGRRKASATSTQRIDDEGRMTLVEHLAELRSRIVKSVLALLLASAGALFFYDELFALLSDPYTAVAADLRRKGIQAELVLSGVATPFVVQLKIATMAGLVIASPVWLYQLWSFVTPGLHRNERRYALAFLGSAVPLFVAGFALCYWALPKGIGILLEFTPSGVRNLTTVDEYLTFVLRMMFVFGIGFVMPVFVVLLNAIGVLPARTLADKRSWVILGIFVFAAVATPTGDPFNLMLVALPMSLLYLAAEFVCRVLERRRGRGGEPDFSHLGDDEISPLDVASRDSADDRPSRLDDAT